MCLTLLSIYILSTFTHLSDILITFGLAKGKYTITTYIKRIHNLAAIMER